MKYAVIYDSIHGNTKEIAEVIAQAFGEEGITLRASEADKSHLESVDLLIAGSPTYGGSPTEAMQAFLKRIEGTSLKDVKVAGFDTRLQSKLVKIFGFAAGKIEKSLKKLGGTSVIEPEGFFVKGGKGPLAENERERAGKWAADIVSRLK